MEEGGAVNCRLSRLYVWSIVLEPMLFFLIASRHITAVSFTLSRFLQIIFLGLLLTRINKFRFPHFGDFRYQWMWLYMGIAVISGILGILLGMREVSNYAEDHSGNILVQSLNSPLIRPLFEYLILAYYILYFSVLPIFFLKTKKTLDYFFKIFFMMFNLSLILGVIDLVFYYCFSSHLIGRHLSGWVGVGGRFHGLFGEPRDAFGAMGLGLALYYFKVYLYKENINKYYFGFIIMCMLLTQSGSGMIGIAIFITLSLILLSLHFLKIILHDGRKLIALFTSCALLIGIIHTAINNSPHILIYLDAITLNSLIEIYNGAAANPIMASQIVNIYPILWIVASLVEYNPIPFFIGGGLGMGAAINSLMGGHDDLANPHSNIVRILAETGTLGLIIYISAFYLPVKKLTKNIPAQHKRALIIFMLLVLSLQLAHRSASVFIYLGIFLAAFNIVGNKKNSQMDVNC